MSSPRHRIVVLGLMSKTPIAGVAWQTIHYLLGFERLGYEVHYVEAHGAPPKMFMKPGDPDPCSDKAAAYIARVLNRFGFRGRWAFHALHDDGRVYGMTQRQLCELFDGAALVINLSGATETLPEHRAGGLLVYLETDPSELQIELTWGLSETIEFLSPHDAFFTFGENLGNADCGLPVDERFLFRPTRQPVLLDLWRDDGPLPSAPFTTVGNWKQPWRTGVKWGDDHYAWSKHHEFLKLMDLPGRTTQRFELALGHTDEEDRAALRERGWSVRDALEISRDADDYRDYIRASRAEFTVAKDQNIRLRSGWFSDRSATYLAAGRPVITQDTGYGNILPTAEGLFPFITADEALEAVERINADPERHRLAAQEIAREYFAHDVVLGALLAELGMTPPARRSDPRFGRPAGLAPSLIVTRRSRRPTALVPQTEAAALGSPVPAPTAAEDAPALPPPLASVVVVTFDGLPFTRLCLESVIANTPPASYELLIVDNGSRDGTVEFLRALAERHHRTVHVIFNEGNVGFAAANNQALRQASGELIVLLNNDTIVPPGWLATLGRHLEDPQVGLVGPVTNEAGNEARIETSYRTYGELVAFARERARDYPGQRIDIRVLTMFCVAMRREVQEQVGELDERFGRGLFEDDDYAMRVRACGRRVVCAEDAFVHHFGQASFGKLVPSGEYGQLLQDNRRRFEEKWEVSWNGHSSRPSPTYERLSDGVRRLVNATVPRGSTVALLTRGDPDLLELDGRRAWHFPRQADGAFAGHYPGHSSEAIRHLEELRALGCGFLVIPEPSLWWLEHYASFGRHLRRACVEVGRDEAGLVYELRAADDAGREPVRCAIAGMHRSGTSMVAGVLSALGMYLGDPADFFDGSLDNPDGYWEDARFVALNERLLEALGASWDCPHALDAERWQEAALSGLRDEARGLLEEFPGEPCWGWKDPRTSLTLPFWRALAPGLRTVVCLREPLDVARSLKRRAMLSVRFSLGLWRAYNEAILLATDPDSRLITCYERILSDPERELRRIATYMSLPADEEALTAACVGIHSWRSSTGAAARSAPNVPGDVAALYQRMCAEADARPEGVQPCAA
jgi:GT2 family glycosyltransferase